MFKFLEVPTPADEVVYGKTKPASYKPSRVARKVLDRVTLKTEDLERRRHDYADLAQGSADEYVSLLVNYLIKQGLLTASGGLTLKRTAVYAASVECYAELDPDITEHLGMRALVRIVNPNSGLNTLYYAKMQESTAASGHPYVLNSLEMVNPKNGHCSGPEDYDNQEMQNLYYNFGDAVREFSPVLDRGNDVEVQAY